ncbi:MAG TPA: hypothetical protein VK485_01725 [Sphingomicrobium sp.]|nr:hypothetical protein [Sphingomicrobium sp.]
MKRISFALVGAAALVLTACNKGEEANNVENYDNAAAENLDAMANNTAEAEALGNQANALANESDNLANAADSGANVDANAEVNAM